MKHGGAGPVFGIPLPNQFASGNYLSGPSPITSSYPFTIGGVVRVDSGTEAFVGASNSATNDEAVSVGLINGFAGIRMRLGSTTDVDEVGTTAVPAGTFAHVQCTFVSDTERRLYLNGNLEATFVTSRNIDGTVTFNTIFVNRIIGVNEDFAGTYTMFWGMQKDLSDAHHAIIYRESQHFTWRGLTIDDGATHQWLLDELSELSPGTTLYRDQFDPAYQAADTLTGVTLDGIGVLPHAPGICAEFAGTNGGINTLTTDYETGTNNRAFECWLEAGFEGVVCSMGANVDAQALVISVDNIGDVHINIRGAGNERVYSSIIDQGTEGHHLYVELDGDSLHDFNVYVDGVDQTTILTPGTDTTLATVATLNFHIGEDVTDIGVADGDGKLYGMTIYDATNVPFTAARIALKNEAGRAVPITLS